MVNAMVADGLVMLGTRTSADMVSTQFAQIILWAVWKGLTHWGRVTHICVGYLTIIGLDNGLAPDRRQAITWTNVGILLIGPLGTNFSEMLIEIHTFSFKKIHLKMSSGKWRPFCLGLNVLKCDFDTSMSLGTSAESRNDTVIFSEARNKKNFFFPQYSALSISHSIFFSKNSEEICHSLCYILPWYIESL